MTAPLFLTFILALGIGGGTAALPEVPQDLPEATVWFLGSSGWAVRIQESLLVFDYHKNYGPGSEEDPGEHGLADGFINPAEMAGFEESIDAAFLGSEPDREDQYFRQAEYLIGLFDVPAVFGGHFGEDLWRCQRFASLLGEAGSGVTVHCPESPGQQFVLKR